MEVSFVLIKTKPGKECDVYNIINKEPEIVEFNQLFGEYDLIVKIETETVEQISQIVVEKIRQVPGIIDTKTLPGIKWESQ